MKYILSIICLQFALLSSAQQPIDSLLFEVENFCVYSQSAFNRDVEIYNAVKDKQRYIIKEEPDSGDCPTFYEGYYTPLSMVGKVYSYEYGAVDAAACGPMANSLGVTSISIETNERVSLMSLLREKDIITALKKDAWVQQKSQNANADINAARSFKEIIELITDISGVQFNTSSFYILGYVEGKAQVRLVGIDYMGYDHAQYVQLGLEIPVKRKSLNKFSIPTNFYKGHFQNIIN